MDLVSEGVEALNKFRDLPRWRMAIAGGDGSIPWVMDYIYATLKPKSDPEVALVPLGTGNDLSRVLGWGKTIPDVEMHDILKSIQGESTLTLLDRWKLTFTYKRQARAWGGLRFQSVTHTTSNVVKRGVYILYRNTCITIVGLALTLR